MKSNISRLCSALSFAVLALAAGGACRLFAPVRGMSATTPGLIAKVTDVPLPGAPVRFDYQSFDPKSGLLYISHMDDDYEVVFDTRRNKTVANIAGCRGSTGVLYVPELNRVYASASA